MARKVTISLDNGDSYSFDSPQVCIVGRAFECEIRVNNTVENCDVSRHHCALNIDPPLAWLQDLSSTNGTFINNDILSSDDLIEVHDGDEIRAGHLKMQVQIGGDEDIEAYQGKQEEEKDALFEMAFTESAWK